VRKALEEVEGVKVESVDIGEARLTWDPGRVDRERIVAAIETVGYSAGWRAGPPEDAKRLLRPS
jgi:copper chaperone CopZ